MVRFQHACVSRVPLVVALWFAVGAGSAEARLDPLKALPQFSVTTWRTGNGLPQDAVSGVVQTPEGYIWLGTQEGLVRFDGSHFDVFNSANTPAFRSNDVRALTVGRDGSLWIAVDSDLVRHSRGEFVRHPGIRRTAHDWLTTLREDRSGNLWVGTFGSGVFRTSGNRTDAFTRQNGLADDFVSAIAETPDGSIWVASAKGVSRFAEGRWVTSAVAAAAVESKKVYALTVDRAGRLWIGSDQGLTRLDRGAARTFTTADGLSSNVVRTILEDAAGALWVGTDGGLSRYAGGSFQSLTKARGLSSDLVLALAEDQEGNLWVGTYGGGLNKLTNRSFENYGPDYGLSDAMARAMYETRDGRFWVGTQSGGLNLFENGRFVRSLQKQDGLPDNYVSALHEGRDGSLWVGTAAGLAKLQNGRLSPVLADGLRGKTIKALLEDPDGTLWIGTRGDGLKILRHGVVTGYDRGSGLSNVVRSFARDAQGALWIGSDEGLSRFDHGRFQTWPLIHLGTRVPAMTVVAGDDGAVWAGSYGGGVYRLKHGQLVQISAANGLLDNIVFAIVDDRRGDLWMTCNKGISRVHKADLEAVADQRARTVVPRVFGLSDGLKSAECNGNVQPSAIRRANGTLWFPTIEGVVAVDPSRMVANPRTPPVLIERVTVDGRVWREVNSVRALPGEGRLTFHFAALSFAAPERIRFKYQLVGFDRGWIDAGDRRDAFYTNIPPGTYHFKVAAANEDGVWNEVGHTVALILAPHFYETGLFYALCGAGILLAMIGVYRLRVRHIHARSARLEAVVAARTAELRQEVEVRVRAEQDLRRAKDEADAANRSKSEFLANVSHEIRTPMNGVLGMARLALETNLTPSQREFLEMVRVSAESLMGVINDILDFSKVEAGKMDLDLVPFGLRGFIGETLKPLAWRASQAGLDFRSSVAPDAEDALIGDVVRLRQIVVNLVGNAIKFTTHGSVTVRVSASPTAQGQVALEIVVADTGIGIAADKRALIFEPFRQADGSTTRKYGGTGLGLAICASLAQLMDGALSVESEAGSGSTFTFRVTLASARSVVQPSPTETRLSGPAAPLDILLAEDNQVNQLLAKRILEKWGHRITVVATGAAAVAEAASRRYDVILMDVQMPEMNGLEATAEIRASASGGDIPIVAMTAHAMTGDRDRCLAAGMTDYIAKPLDVSILRGILERVTSRPAMARDVA